MVTDNNIDELDELDELDSLFGGEDAETKKMQSVVLSQNLEGFASCFPEWDIHPPIRK